MVAIKRGVFRIAVPMVRLICLLLLGISIAAGGAAAEPARLALLIGNQTYAAKVGPLKNPARDIDLVGAALEKLDFKVTKLANASKLEMDEAIRRYADQVRRAGPKAISFFYYSGHGVVNPETNVNYLIPVDLDDAATDAVWYRSIEQPALIELLSRAKNATHFIVFDACRNELNLAGEAGKALGADKGFVPVGDVSGILIAYATAQKKTAADTGMFARILSEELVKDGVEAFAVFREVQVRVTETMKQEPWMSLNYIPRIYLGKAAELRETQPQSSDAAARAWADIKDFQDAAVFEAFRKQYGPSNALYDTLAAQKIADLKRQRVAVVAPQKPVADEDACEGLLVSVAVGARPCIKPGSGESFKDCPDCPEMVIAPSGSFTMGSSEKEDGRYSDEGPQHNVTIPRPLAVGRTHVTRGQFAAFVKATSYDASGGCWTLVNGEWKQSAEASWKKPGFEQGDDHPAVCLNWNDAKAYIDWLNKKAPGKPYRLLTEAEAEYAARAVTKPGAYPRFFFGNDEASLCQFGNGADQTAKASGKTPASWTYSSCRDGYVFTAPAGSFKPNAWGVYDAAGNAWTWTEDCWHDGYASAPTDGSAWTSGDCSRRVLRGGSWNGNPRILRAANRNRDFPDGRGNGLGFRLARTLNP